jgi:hypothetical protein
LLNPVIQRLDLQEEPVQKMPQLGLLNPVIQRVDLQEEPVQKMPQLGVIQRQEQQGQEELIQSKLVQPKLVVGQRGDKYEQEADSMAAQVMSMNTPPANSGLVQRQGEEEEKEPLVQKSPLADSITPLVQRQELETTVQPKCSQCEQEEQVQTKAAEQGSNQASSNIESQLSSSKGGGSPLPDEVRSFMEPRFGTDFSKVRVHTDSSAVQMNKELGAQAFTHGSDIYYGAGKSPGQNDLTAHELTHVVQQTGGVQAKPTVGQLENQHKPEANGAWKSQPYKGLVDETGAVATAKTNVPQGMNGKELSTTQKVGGKGTNQTTRKPGAAANSSAAKAHALMHSELGEAAQQPGVKVAKTEGSPAVLMPSETPPEKPGVVPHVPLTPTPTPELPHQDKANQATTHQTSSANAKGALNGTPTAAATQQLAKAKTMLPSSGVASNKKAAPPVNGAAHVTDQKSGNLGGAGLKGAMAGAKAGTDMVLPQLPKASLKPNKGRIPSLEEFLTVFKSGRTVEQDRAKAKQLVNGLHTEVTQEKAAVLNQTKAHKAKITTQAQTQIAALHAKMETQTSTIKQHYAKARTNLTSQVDKQKAALQAKVAQEIAQVESDTQKRITEANAKLTQRKNDFTAFVQEQSQQPRAIAQQESNRANSEIDAAANQAEQVGEAEASRYPGSEDPAPKQREAAHQTANKSATDIRGKKSSIAQDLQSRATDFSSRYPAYSNKIGSQIEDVRKSIVPAMHEAATKTIADLQKGRDTALQTIQGRLQGDLQALNTAEANTIHQVPIAGQKAIEQIQTIAKQTASGIDAVAAALVAKIEHTAGEASTVVAAEEVPYLPGIVEVIQTARRAIKGTAATGHEQLNNPITAASQHISQVVTSFDTQAKGLTSTAQQSADAVQKQALHAINQILQTRSEHAHASIEQLHTKQQSLISEALSEIDSALEKARSEVRGLTEKFRSEIKPATDKSIAEAKKPLTDPLPDRVHGAAQQAGESWWSGLLRAVEQIAVGFLIVVVVALVVAAVAAAFGVILTAWTAIMIAGAILLLVGLAISLYQRFTQKELANASPWEKIGLALADTTGITGIVEGVTGKDIVTGQPLDAGERTFRGTTGAFTLVMLVLGARAAVEGPPGGAYTRPTGMPRGWVGWDNAIPSAWKGIKSVGVELYTGLRQGVKNLADWVRDRMKSSERSGASTNPDQQQGGQNQQQSDPNQQQGGQNQQQSDPNQQQGGKPGLSDTETKLQAIRDTLTDPAKAEFDAMRNSFRTPEEFLQKLESGDLGNPKKMFEGRAQAEAAKANKQATDTKLLQETRNRLDATKFFERPDIIEVINKGDISGLRGKIALELARQEAARTFPSEKGYQSYTDVLLAEEVPGYSTRAQWVADNPGKNPNSVYELNGKLWRPLTDVDLMVVKSPPKGGPDEIVHMEQIKSGKRDSPAQATQQIGTTLEAFKRIHDGDSTVQVHLNRGTDITGKFDAGSASSAEALTRGPEGKKFDKSLGLTAEQINALIDQILGEKGSTGGSP